MAQAQGRKREVLDTIEAAAGVEIPRNRLRRDELLAVAEALGVPVDDELTNPELRAHILLQIDYLTPADPYLTSEGFVRYFRVQELAAILYALQTADAGDAG